MAFTSETAREAGKKAWAALTPEQRSEIVRLRHAAARWPAPINPEEQMETPVESLFVIGAPVKFTPTLAGLQFNSVFESLKKAIEEGQLADGSWLPFTFKDVKTAASFRHYTQNQRTQHGAFLEYEFERTKNTVYIRLKPEEKESPKPVKTAKKR